MRVFVTGATGYIGRRLVPALVRAGHDVVGLIRDEARVGALKKLPGTRWVKGDLAEPAEWKSEARACDALVHLAMEMSGRVVDLDRGALDALLAAARDAKSARIVIYTSGIWVLGNTGDKAVDERAPVDHPSPIVAWRPAHERAVLEATRPPVTTAVIRPGLVFGSKGGLTAPFFESAIRDGEATFVGGGKNRWPTVQIDDLADLYVRVLELAEKLRTAPATDRLFHGVDGTADRVEEIARAASLAAGKEGRTRATVLSGLFGDALQLDQVIAATNAERLGWRPRWRGFVRNAGEAFAEWSAKGS